MLSINGCKIARWVTGVVLAGATVAWQASDAAAAKRLIVGVFKDNLQCGANGAGTPYYGQARGFDIFAQAVCNVAATGGTAFNDSPACVAALSHQPRLVTQVAGAGNPVVVAGCNGGTQLTWTTLQTLNCSTPNSVNCPGGANWTVQSRGAN